MHRNYHLSTGRPKQQRLPNKFPPTRGETPPAVSTGATTTTSKKGDTGKPHVKAPVSRTRCLSWQHSLLGFVSALHVPQMGQ